MKSYKAIRYQNVGSRWSEKEEMDITADTVDEAKKKAQKHLPVKGQWYIDNRGDHVKRTKQTYLGNMLFVVEAQNGNN